MMGSCGHYIHSTLQNIQPFKIKISGCATVLSPFGEQLSLTKSGMDE